MRRMAIVCCALWLVAGAGCASQQQAPGATKPWYQLGSWKKPAQPEANSQMQIRDIRDMRTSNPGDQQAAAGMQPGIGQQPNMGSAGMASASSVQQY
jgi:hypothetical protein